MNDMLQDPMFLYTVCFAVFLALVWHFGRKPILAWLDGEILKIRNELEQARKLRAEAEAMLADTKVKQAEAAADAAAIVQRAKEEAVRLQAQAEADLKSLLEKHAQQAAERIRIAEAEALADVRMAAIDLAMQMARTTLAAQLDEAAATKLVDQAIADMSALAAAKAKAA